MTGSGSGSARKRLIVTGVIPLAVAVGAAFAVPPLLTIRHPAECSPRARSTIPDLSYTESSAMGMYKMYVAARGARAVS